MDFDRALEEPIIEPIIERTKIRDLLKFFIVIPECQREKEWDNDMYYNAIDSIIKNIDIGQLIISVDNMNKNLYEIIDGQHRYEAIKKFIQNEIPIISKDKKHIYFNILSNNEQEIFLDKKITLCMYHNLSKLNKSILYTRINYGLEQNIEHMEKINDISNIKNFITKYQDKLDLKYIDNADNIINTILYVNQDYYYNGEGKVTIKNLTKKNHFLKNLNKMNNDYNELSIKHILDTTEYLLKEIIKEQNKFYMELKNNKKIKLTFITSIIYHIFHENYKEINDKTFKFNDKLNVFYYKILKDLEKIKNQKIGQIFNFIIMKFDVKYIESSDSSSEYSSSDNE